MGNRLAAAARAAACAAACALCGTALAQARDLTTLPLEELLRLEVVSASRFAQHAAEAPAAVTVITADDIRVFGWRTLTEVLASVRGVHVTHDRNYARLGVYGFGLPGDYNTRVQLLIDGVRTNDNIYDQAAIGTEFPLDLDLVERIEFVPGPGASVYGANAFFGVLNVITRRDAAARGASLAAGAGTFGRREGRATWGGKLEGGAELLVSASAMRARGPDLRFDEFEARGVPDGAARGLDFDRNRQLFARVSLGPWSGRLIHSERTKGVPTAAFGTAPGEPGTQTVDEHTSVDFAYDGALERHLELGARAYYSRYLYDGDYAYGPAPTVNNVDQARGTWWGGEARLVHTGWQNHKAVFGAELQVDSRMEQRNYDEFGMYLDDRRRGSRIGLYVQDEVTLQPELLLNAGLRFDRTSGRRGLLNPRVALIHRTAPRLTLKAIHGWAYRPPNAYEKYYTLAVAGALKGNPDLRDERIRTSELVAELNAGGGWQLTGNAFRYTVRDLIEAVIDPADGRQVYLNAGRAASSGIGLELERRAASGARLRANLTLQRAEDGAGNWMVNSPRRLLKLAGALPLGGGATGGAELQATSRRRTLAGEVGGYAVAHLNVIVPFAARNAEFSVGARNLFNRRYADPGGPEHIQDRLEQDGRTLLVRVRFAL